MGISTEHWPRLSRSARLEGGIEALCAAGSPRVDLMLGQNQPSAFFEISEYAHFFGSFDAAGLRMIGVEFVDSLDELNGTYPPTWRAWGQKEGWIAWEARQNASSAAHNLLDADLMNERDICLRVADQLRISEYRLANLWRAYAKVLRSVRVKNSEEIGCQFSNGWLDLVALEVHSLFHDLGSLRDYIVELISVGVLHHQFSGRWRSAGKFVEKYKQFQGSSELADELFHECTVDDLGSLKQLGDYRDLITHSAPIQCSDSLFNAHLIEIEAFGASLPAINVYLPQEVVEIRRRRAKGLFPRSKAEWGEELKANWGSKGAREYDCLRYAHTISMKMAKIVDRAIDQAGYDVSISVIRDSDLAGPIKVKTYQRI